MELSARLFGVNAWSILVPQALEGVAAVGLLYAAVRRWFGAGAGLLAGAVLALTPVAALMFRFNNPDALLVLLLTGGRLRHGAGPRSGQTRWLIARRHPRRFRVHHQDAAGLPRRARLRPRLPDRRAAHARRRLVQLLVAGVALVVSACGGWSPCMAVPASRPPVHRRLAEQQPLEPDLRLQRLRAPHRQRVGQRRRGAAARRGRWGADRVAPHVQHRRSAARSPGCSRPR